MKIGDKVRIVPGVGVDPDTYRNALGIGTVCKITKKGIVVDWPKQGKRSHKEKFLELVTQ